MAGGRRATLPAGALEVAPALHPSIHHEPTSTLRRHPPLRILALEAWYRGRQRCREQPLGSPSCTMQASIRTLCARFRRTAGLSGPKRRRLVLRSTGWETRRWHLCTCELTASRVISSRTVCKRASSSGVSCSGGISSSCSRSNTNGSRSTTPLSGHPQPPAHPRHRPIVVHHAQAHAQAQPRRTASPPHQQYLLPQRGRGRQAHGGLHPRRHGALRGGGEMCAQRRPANRPGRVHPRGRHRRCPPRR